MTSSRFSIQSRKPSMMPTDNIFIDKILKKDFETPKILTDNIFRNLPLGCPPEMILRN